jgi:hypothetical protein
MARIAPLFCSSHDLTDEQLLVLALRGDKSAQPRLVRRLNRHLVNAVKRRATALPEDLRQDVLQELWAAVFARADSVAFDPSTGSARDYVAGFLGLAFDRVRAAYRAPGERSRRRDAMRNGARLYALQVVLVSLDDLDEGKQLADPSCRAELRRVEARIDIGRARALASPLVARAIKLMWEEDWGHDAAAAAVGVNRVTLRRQLLQLGSRLAAA